MVFFDEDDIRKELEEMGYTPNRKLIADLRKAIARADEHRAADENYESTHPFLGLDIESHRPMREEERMAQMMQSPLITKSKGRNPLRWHPQIPHPIDTITFADPSLDGLMEKAYKCVERTYTLVDEVEDMKTALEEMDLEEMMERADREARRAISEVEEDREARRAISEGEEDREARRAISEGEEDRDARRAISEGEEDREARRANSASTIRDKDERLEKRGKKGTMNEELKERVDRIRERRMGAARKQSSSSAVEVESTGGRTIEGMETLPGAVGLEGGVRPVLVPEPGRRPFRFDPVNRIGIYQQASLDDDDDDDELGAEWKRLPAPGEKKRLSLRWKIREQLLHRDVPRFNREDPTAALQVPPLLHEKDWSPRPYLD
ncbi:hyls-1 [Pristionchus pacificus]|uniref:Uncharacterized protein n=1 Tax=Pristionchus pacificus TaxID=54126 RepID=A0A8R1V4M0_PRIPA|nr:hyls-1 [Pristionchus pacificus]